MTVFEQLDPAIEEWAKERQVPLYTSYKGDDVRSFQVVGSSGAACQIWIEVGNVVSLIVWDYGARRRTFATEPGKLKAALDGALAVARGWAE